MRKSFIAAGAAALSLGVAGVAYAQVAPAPTGTAKVAPSAAGTKAKPKSVKLTLNVTNPIESKTTAAKITITLPSTLKLKTTGLKECKLSDNDIFAGKCASSKAGAGTAHAMINPFAPQPAPIDFTVTPLIGHNEILFFLVQQGGGVKAILHGKITGRKLAIAIPDFLQQPAPGTYSALTGLSTTLSAKKGKNALLSSTGCTSKAYKIGVKINYVPNPTPPAVSSASTSASAPCK